MDRKEIYIPPVITPQGLDKMVHKMYACINQALDKTCPTAQESVVSKGNPWFTEALKEKRKHMFKLHDKWQAQKTPSTEAEYKSYDSEYRKHCDRVKQIYRSYYKETLQTEADMAGLMHQILRKDSPRIGTLQLFFV